MIHFLESDLIVQFEKKNAKLFIIIMFIKMFILEFIPLKHKQKWLKK